MPAKADRRTPLRRAPDRRPRLVSRELPLRLDPALSRPDSLDEAARSVEVTASTEAPAWVMDWERFEPVLEVLLMSGCSLPAAGSVPLLDAHSRFSVKDVIGSFQGIRVVQGASGPELAGRAVFSATEDGEKPFRKVCEGHVTDVSIGYEVNAHIMLREGENTMYEGKSYTGPLRIGIDWSLKELSLCPIGADEGAKIRAAASAARTATPAPAAGRNKENAMAKPSKGGAKSAAKTSGLKARLRAMLGLRADEDEQKPAEEEERQDVEILDDDGNPVAPEELSEEELEEVAEILTEVLEDVEAEQGAAPAASSASSAPSDDERKARRQSARAAVASARAGSLPGSVSARSLLHALGPDLPARMERKRVLGIQNLARAHNIAPDMEQRLINDNLSLRQAKDRISDMLHQRPNNTGPGFHVETGRAEQDKFRSALQDTLLLRCNLPLLKYEIGSEEWKAEMRGQRSLRQAAPGAEELRALPLSMLCREALQRSGQRVPGDVRQIVGRALTTTDLPMLLIETSSRQLMESFETAEETWHLWCQTGIATDFKKSRAIGLEADMKPRKKREYGEYEHGELDEVGEEWFIEEFGRMIIISRQAIINDDLDALTQIPTECGEQTAEMVGDVAYAALLSSPNTMGDGKSLFHTDHKNLYTGLGGVPTVDSLGAMVTGMKKQVNGMGQRKPQVPRYYIAPVSLETAAEQFFLTQLEGRGVVGTSDAPLIHNQFAGNRFTRVYDSRLDEVSEGDVYLAAARSTVRVFFLGGVEAPFIDSEVEFNSDAVKTKVRMDVGAKAMRWITLAKATAPAP